MYTSKIKYQRYILLIWSLNIKREKKFMNDEKKRRKSGKHPLYEQTFTSLAHGNFC